MRKGIGVRKGVGMRKGVGNRESGVEGKRAGMHAFGAGLPNPPKPTTEGLRDPDRGLTPPARRN
jgi:hypothetical protein